MTHLTQTIERLAAEVKGARRVLLAGPTDADGDSVGASLALAEVMRRCNPSLVAVVASGAPIPRRYHFLEGCDSVVGPDELEGPFDMAIVLDGVRHRIGDVGPAFDAAPCHVLVDHHRSSDPGDYHLPIWDAARSSTCEIVHEIAGHPSFAVPLDRILAEHLYAGIVFDTGAFRYSNTSPETLRAAAAMLEQGIDAQRIIERLFLDTRAEDMVLRGRVMADVQLDTSGKVAHGCVTLERMRETRATGEATEGLVSTLVFIEGVQAAALFIELPAGGIRVSLRSRGQVDVAGIARRLSSRGGGHDRAAGLTLDGPLDGAVQRVIEQLRAGLGVG